MRLPSPLLVILLILVVLFFNLSKTNSSTENASDLRKVEDEELANAEEEAEKELTRIWEESLKKYEEDAKKRGFQPNLFEYDTSLLDERMLKLWENVQNREKELDATAGPDDCQYLIGVFSYTDSILPRMFQRSSWMSHPLVCNSCRKDCKIVAKFILGAPLSKESWTEALIYHDMFTVDTMENMNHGKSYTWIKAAANLKRRYKAVFKMDTDSRLSVQPFLQTMQKAPKKNAFYGEILNVDCKLVEKCPPSTCKPHVWTDECWWYCSGGLYGLSQDLVDWVAKDDIPAQNQIGTEDLMVGYWLWKGGKLPKMYRIARGGIWQHEKGYARLLNSELDQVLKDPLANHRLTAQQTASSR